ncbi:hypothetical protein CAEBREN_07706 [Caenorhabditis brenneri]|uniref:Sdz-33 F-box domain-containing protein n=1 Tax=Caenorhabditis brenneri TaxID=135651 RepID=G0N2G2_CAEBE|nr:hypothetical protein CAEBREN_07706 [Caenorhabditis brenneri]
MKRVVKREVRVRNHGLICFLGSEFFSLEFENNGRQLESISLKSRIKKPKIGVLYMVSLESENNMRFLRKNWRSAFIGVMEIYKEILEIFKMPISKFVVDLNSVRNEYKSVIHWFNSPASHQPMVEVNGEKCSYEVYSWVLDNIKSSEDLRVFAEPRTFSTKEARSITADKLFINFGGWIDSSHLKLMESKRIIISNSTITDEEINRFLHSLTTGSDPNLTFLVFEIYRDPNFFILMDGLDAIEIGNFEFSFKLNNGKRCRVSNVIYGEEEELNLQGIEIQIVL